MRRRLWNRINYFQLLVELPIAALLLLFLAFVLFHISMPLPDKKPYSQLLLDRDGDILHTYLSADDKWRFALESGDISERYRQALLYKEDRHFYWHPGINPGAIIRAAFDNAIAGRRTSGASTITMQLARLIEPKQRTYGNKLKEMFRALQLEYLLSKNEILTRYLELAPFGGNIEGIKAASLFYYGKLPARLSPAEIAALVVIPNRPNSLTPGEDNAALGEARNRWIRKLTAAGIFTSGEAALALAEPLTGRRLSAPAAAPHLSRRIHQSSTEPNIRLNIDTRLQRVCENLISDRIKKLQRFGIHNAAALVVDNHSGQVLAYVGSADFNNPTDDGQVDGITAIRSPGSTLKPLLYGLAIDNGTITPNTILADVPLNVAGYSPENYSGKYYGAVTAEYALTQSLNIPLVKLLEQTGLEKFLTHATQAGLKSLSSQRKSLGLSTILGGCGVSLEDLVIMYSGFSRGGSAQKLQFSNSALQSRVHNDRFLSAESSFLITEALQKLTRPNIPQNWQYGKNMEKIAWKTGTSYGRRDAWSIGYTDNYTVGVWVGNFSGSGVPELVGAEMAAPLLFDIFKNLNTKAEQARPLPENLDYRLVCSLSGKIPAELCTHTRIDAYIPGISSNEKCEVETLVRISADSTKSYCLTCSPATGFREVMYEIYPAEIAEYYSQNSGARTVVPPHNPDCSRIFEKNAPVITSPVEGLTYYVNPTDSTRIKFSALATAGVQKMFWFVDNQPIETAEAAGSSGDLFVFLKEGRQKITCTDDRGRTENIWIDVEYVPF